MRKTRVVISILLVTMLTVLSAISVSAYSGVAEAEADNEYNSYVEEFMNKYTRINDVTGEEEVYGYSTELIYEHYDDSSAKLPDYMVLFVYCNGNADIIYYELNGYYYYGYLDYQYNSTPSYLVFDVETKEVSWLADALKKDFDKYFDFISESNYERIVRIGDVNRDNELNIKDATEIQRYIAGIDSFINERNDKLLGFEEKMFGKWERYVSDFNRDGNRNIKDATAIQKHIAGIE